jgi:hypothetical protein
MRIKNEGIYSPFMPKNHHENLSFFGHKSSFLNYSKKLQTPVIAGTAWQSQPQLNGPMLRICSHLDS